MLACKERNRRNHGRSIRRRSVRLRKTARKSITGEKSNRLVLSEKDSKAFIEAIENPPAPCEKLKNALKLYRKAMPSAKDRGLM
jgi:hypothetical protein